MSDGLRCICRPISSYIPPQHLDGGTGTRLLLWTVVATLPIKDHAQTVIKRSLHLIRADVAMLLAVSHDNAQFIRLPVDGVFLSVHGAELEHSGSGCVASEGLGHPLQDLRGQFPSQRKCPRAGRVGQSEHRSYRPGLKTSRVWGTRAAAGRRLSVTAGPDRRHPEQRSVITECSRHLPTRGTARLGRRGRNTTAPLTGDF